MNQKVRIDQLLVDRQLVSSREKAKKYILAGLVFVNNQLIDKVGAKVPLDGEITIKGNPLPYVSRGGLKLEKALREFNCSVVDKKAIDIGASTGGFTDCLLQHGASAVIAVDVGYGQLDWKLRNDKRVFVLERTNIRYLDISNLPYVPEIATVDVSFISLTKILPKINELLAANGEIISLIKPQFEAGKDKVGKNGVVKSREVHKEVLFKVADAAIRLGLSVLNLTFSPITGPKGNIEYLYYFSKNQPSSFFDLKTAIDKTVSTAWLECK
ncbi:MAG TPA: TlyA family RNA methyltransferase [Clostridia bacterium]|nr:TlyA family RNA methyltransferase [Clostridia bacterium]